MIEMTAHILGHHLFVKQLQPCISTSPLSIQNADENYLFGDEILVYCHFVLILACCCPCSVVVLVSFVVVVQTKQRRVKRGALAHLT